MQSSWAASGSLPQNAGVHSHLWTALRWVGIPAVAVFTLVPGLRAGPSLDAAVFGLVGRQMANGVEPYVDAWDHKPPGVHLIHAVAELLAGLDQWGWTWLLTLLTTIATSWLLVGILRAIVPTPVAMVTGLVGTLGLGHFMLSLGGGMSESFAILPATAGLAVSLSAGPTAARSGLAGFLVGLTVLISPQLAPAGVALLTILAPAGGVPVMAYVAGAAAPALGLLAWLGPVGALPAFADALFAYNAAYRGTAGPGLGLLPWVVLVLVPLAAPALAGVLALRRGSRITRRLGLGSLAWIVTAVVLVALQGRLYGHYAIGIVVPLTILAAIGVADGSSRISARPLRSGMAGIGAGLVALSLLIGAAAAHMELLMIEAVNTRASAVAGWVQREGLQGQPMLVWGNAPQVYVRAASRPATRFGFLYPLTTRGYATTAIVADELRRLEASPPSLVVDAGSRALGEPGFPPLLIKRPSSTDGRDLDLLDPLRIFVAERYELVEVVEGWPIYRLTEPAD